MKFSWKQAWWPFVVTVLLIGAVWTWMSRDTMQTSTAGRIPAPRQGFLAPDFSLQTAQGETIQLSDLRGQAVLLNIWASWCTPCRAEMPAMQRIYEEYQGRGFELLAVNSTSQDRPERAIAFAQELGLSFPILFDTQGKVNELYQTRALPTSFFIDQEGIIREVVIGGPMAEALLRIRVEQLLDDRPGGSP